MTHYICTGECKGKSEKPGICQAENCSKHNQPLTECHCEDGKHGTTPPENPTHLDKEVRG